jgi:hypothetical protein
MSRKMKNNVAAYVKDDFGMELSEFIRFKVEAESLHDYEIAKILGLQPADVGRLRRSLSALLRRP